MAKTEIECNACGNKFLKDNREINRNSKVGRNNYCNSKCAATITKRNLEKVDPKNIYDISQHSKLADNLSPFRLILKRLNNSSSPSSKRKSCYLTLEDLEEQWLKQSGICPLTGESMVLKSFPKKGELGKQIPYQASVDRIDNNKPYEVGNIRFIALIANYARHTFTDEQLIEFCGKVVQAHC